jgi:hypothetical protein
MLKSQESENVASAISSIIANGEFWKIVKIQLKAFTNDSGLSFWDKFKKFWKELFLAVIKLPSFTSLGIQALKGWPKNGEELFETLTHEKILNELSKKAETISSILKKRFNITVTPELTHSLINILRDQKVKDHTKIELIAVIDDLLNKKSKEDLNKSLNNLYLKLITATDHDSTKDLIMQTVQTLDTMVKNGETRKIISDLLPANLVPLANAIASHSSSILEKAATTLGNPNVQTAAIKIANGFMSKDARQQQESLQEAVQLFISDEAKPTRQALVDILGDKEIVARIPELIPEYFPTSLTSRLVEDITEPATNQTIKELQKATKAILETDLLVHIINRPEHLPKIAEDVLHDKGLPAIARDALTMVDSNEEIKKIIESNPQIITNALVVITKTIFKDITDDLDLDPELLKILNVALKDVTLTKELLEGISTNDLSLTLQSISKLLFNNKEISKEMLTFIGKPEFVEQLSAVISKVSFDQSGNSWVKLPTFICTEDEYQIFIQSFNYREKLISDLESWTAIELNHPNSSLSQLLNATLGDLSKIVSKEEIFYRRIAENAAKPASTTLDVKQILKSCPTYVLKKIIDMSNIDYKQEAKSKLDLFEQEKTKNKKKFKERLTAIVRPAIATLSTHSETLQEIVNPLINLEKENTNIKNKWKQELDSLLTQDIEIRGIITATFRDIPKEKINSDTLLPYADQIATLLNEKSEIPELKLKALSRPEQFQLVKKVLKYLQDNKDLIGQLDSIILGINADTNTLKAIKQIYTSIGGLKNIDKFASAADNLGPIVDAVFGNLSWTEAAIAIPTEIVKLTTKTVSAGIGLGKKTVVGAAATVYNQATSVAQGAIDYIKGEKKAKPKTTQNELSTKQDSSIDKLINAFTDKICLELFQTKAQSQDESRYTDRLLIQKHISQIINTIFDESDDESAITDLLKQADSIVGHKHDRTALLTSKKEKENLANLYYKFATKHTAAGILTGGIQIREDALTDRSFFNTIKKYLESKIVYCRSHVEILKAEREKSVQEQNNKSI